MSTPWWRDWSWWLREVAIVSLLAIAIFVMQWGVDDRREERATRLENLRFVRERSSPDPEAARPFQFMVLQEQTLTGLSLHKADFWGADLTRANLTSADLADANLTGADLTRVTLTGAWSPGANLTRANLSRADLTSAYLHRANLTSANLAEANLTGANLTETNLSGVDLSNICQFDRSRTPKLPPGVALPDPNSLQPCKKPTD